MAIGNAIVTRAGPPSLVVLVTPVYDNIGSTVYNFEVEDNHTYFVGIEDGGVWVHNEGEVCPIPGAYMNMDHVIDMTNGPRSSLNAAGHPRNCTWFNKQLFEEFPAMFSNENRDRIFGTGAYKWPVVPIVDEQWVKYNPTHEGFMGQTLEHHHIDQGAYATNIPYRAHETWHAQLHPDR